jgi:hypothetical protein
MINLNSLNGADKILLRVARRLTHDATLYKKHGIKAYPLIGAEFGVAYGGGVEAIGRLWKPVGGTIYGFDTFDGHPKQLAESPDEHESWCMDAYYEKYGTELLSYDVQRKALDEAGITNVVLVKGLISEKLCGPYLPHLHYALLDLDIVASMRIAWNIVRPRMVSGGYLCLHDVIPSNHMTKLHALYHEILVTNEYDIVSETPQSYLVVLRRR